MKLSDTKIGDIVVIDSEALLIAESDNSCDGCLFDKGNCRFDLACTYADRKDGKNIIFIKPGEVKIHSEEKQCFDIGEEFHYGLRRMKCVEATGGGGALNYYCKGCYFFDEYAADGCIDFKESCGLCKKEFRPDKKNVIFVELK